MQPHGDGQALLLEPSQNGECEPVMDELSRRHPLTAPASTRPPRVFIGGICLDHFKIVPDYRLGRKNMIKHQVRSVGGGAANHALVHRFLAPEVPLVLLAGLGNDLDGQDLRRHLQQKNITMPWAAVPEHSTSWSDIYTHDGRGTVAVNPGVRSVPVPLDLVDKALCRAEACSVISLGRNDQIADLIRLAARHEVPVFVGLGSTQVEELTLRELHAALAEPVDMVICNRIEASRLTSRLTGRDHIREQLTLLRGDTIRLVVVTDGASGLHALTDGGYLHLDAFSDGRPVIDDTGAGDATAATVIWSLLEGMSVEEALIAGARQGFEACTKLGSTTALVGPDILREHITFACAR
jgi:sugar/nucleoside kinase (ribokinase family)